MALPAHFELKFSRIWKILYLLSFANKNSFRSIRMAIDQIGKYFSFFLRNRLKRFVESGGFKAEEEKKKERKKERNDIPRLEMLANRRIIASRPFRCSIFSRSMIYDGRLHLALSRGNLFRLVETLQIGRTIWCIDLCLLSNPIEFFASLFRDRFLCSKFLEIVIVIVILLKSHWEYS